MTKALFRNLSPLLPLLLAGCAATTNPTAGKPGEGKGYWVTENAPLTGSMQPRRYWVSTESGAPTTTAATNGTGVNSYGGNVPTGIGSTTGALSGGGGTGGTGGGFGGAGGGGR